MRLFDFGFCTANVKRNWHALQPRWRLLFFILSFSRFIDLGRISFQLLPIARNGTNRFSPRMRSRFPSSCLSFSQFLQHGTPAIVNVKESTVGANRYKVQGKLPCKAFSYFNKKFLVYTHTHGSFNGTMLRNFSPFIKPSIFISWNALYSPVYSHQLWSII